MTPELRGSSSTMATPRSRSGSGLARNNLEQFEELLTVPMRRVARIEPRFQTAVDESSSFDDFVARFDQSLDDAAKKQRVIAFKSVIAYRSGLHIERPTDERGRGRTTRRRRPPGRGT